ncbi:MAG: ABC transporter permease [Pseudomonadota bacterium]
MQQFVTNLEQSQRVIHALILREINGRFGASRLGYLWAILGPLISIGALYFIFSFFRERDTQDMPLLMFLVTGWFTFGFYTSMVNDLANAASSNQALLMHAPVQRLDVLTARGTLVTFTTFAFFVIAAVLGMLIEGSGLPHDVGLVMQSFAGAGALGISIGTTISAIMTYFPFAMNFLQPVNRIGFFVSGVLFTASILPSWTHAYLKWNPMIHPVEGMRQGWFESYQSPVLDLRYTYGIALPLMAIGLYLERRTRRGIKF